MFIVGEDIRIEEKNVCNLPPNKVEVIDCLTMNRLSNNGLIL